MNNLKKEKKIKRKIVIMFEITFLCFVSTRNQTHPLSEINNKILCFHICVLCIEFFVLFFFFNLRPFLVTANWFA